MTGADETKLVDFDLVRLQAQHDELVQSAWLEFVLELDADTHVVPLSDPCSATQAATS